MAIKKAGKQPKKTPIEAEVVNVRVKKKRASKKKVKIIYPPALPADQAAEVQREIDRQSRQKRRPLKVKEALVIKGIVAGKSRRKAGIDAGITGSPEVVSATVSRMLKNVNVQEELMDALDRKGISIDRILAPAVKALDAKVIVRVGSERIKTDEDDLEMQLKGHDRLMKIVTLGQKDDKPAGNTIIFNQQNNLNQYMRSQND